MGNWVWFNCRNPACGHYRAMALAPIAIKLGLDAPFDRVQELARCAECGRLGAHTTGPSFGGIDAGWMQFPAARPSGSLNGHPALRCPPIPTIPSAGVNVP